MIHWYCIALPYADKIRDLEVAVELSAIKRKEI